MRKAMIAHLRKKDEEKSKSELIRELNVLRVQLERAGKLACKRGSRCAEREGDSGEQEEPWQPIIADFAVQKSEELYRVLVENADDVILLCDLNFNILFRNKAYYSSLGFEVGDDESLEGVRRIHPDDLDVIEEKKRELFEKGRVEYEYRIKHADDHWVHRFAKSLLIFDSKNRKEAVLSIIRDITMYKEAVEQASLHEEQLIQADKMVALGTLVSGVAHEINNPNNFIMLNVPIVEKAWSSILPILDEYYMNHGDFFVGNRLKYSRMKESIPMLFSGILEGSKRIKNIVEELKDFSRQETYDLNQMVDINEVVKAAVTLVDNLVKRTTNLFMIQYGPDLPRVKGNFQRLEQVIINLLENSCQAIDQKEKAISLSTHFDPSANIILVRVRDEGVGMDPGILKKILEPFFTTKRHKKGTGLGLSVSSNIIKQHDGFLNFESTPGKGTTATIILPVHPG